MEQNHSTCATSTISNLIGQLEPLAVGIVTVPVLLRHLGADRFGIIAIVWMLIGYFSLFDRGPGRGLTQVVAKMLGSRDHEQIPPLFWTSLAVMFLLSLVGAILMTVLTGPPVYSILNVTPSLRPETEAALRLTAFSLPVVPLTAGLAEFLSASGMSARSRRCCLGGEWRYTDRDTLDITHLRFFTRSSSSELVEADGLKVDKVLSNSLVPGSTSWFATFLSFGLLKPLFEWQYLSRGVKP